MKTVSQKFAALRKKPEFRLMSGFVAFGVVAVALSVGHAELDIVALSAVFR